MSSFTLNINGFTTVVESGRVLSGGVAHTELGTFLQQLVGAVAPNVPVTVVANNTTCKTWFQCSTQSLQMLMWQMLLHLT